MFSSISADLLDLYGNLFRKDYIIQVFKSFLKDKHSKALNDLRLSHGSTKCFIVVHFSEICEYDNTFIRLLFYLPRFILDLFNEAFLLALETDLYSTAVVRLIALPYIEEVHFFDVPTFLDLNKLISLSCKVIRSSPVFAVGKERIYSCNICNKSLLMHCIYQQFNLVEQTSDCDCGFGSKFEQTISVSKPMLKNYQELIITEIRLTNSSNSLKTFKIALDDDLVGMVRPGDEIIVNGIVMCRWQLQKPARRNNVEIFLKANSIEIIAHVATNIRSSVELTSDFKKYFRTINPLRARNSFLASISASVTGLYLPKLALVLALIGSYKIKMKDHCISRENIHILLVGDPGVAKSVLIKSVAAISHRGIITNATSCTTAGLTASSIRDGKTWQLEAGALVLANDGICVIDEFSFLKSDQIAVIHEVMEQQTLTVNKMGIRTQLTARCSVLGALNPPKKITKDQWLRSSPSLLSRFDIIFCLKDPVGRTEWDVQMASSVFSNNYELDNNFNIDSSISWNRESQMKYVHWVRQSKPQLTPECLKLIQEYYLYQRTRDDDNLAQLGRLTPRMLESLVRLTISHARLMARKECNIVDTIMAIYIMDKSLESLVGIPLVNKDEINSHLSIPVCEELVLSDFPVNSEKDFLNVNSYLRGKLDI